MPSGGWRRATHTRGEILAGPAGPASELHIASGREADVGEERLRAADMRPPQNMRLQHFVGSHVQRSDLHKLAEHCGPEGLVSHTHKRPASKRQPYQASIKPYQASIKKPASKSQPRPYQLATA